MKYGFQAIPGVWPGNRLAGQARILLPGAFHVHREQRLGAPGKYPGDHLGAHAVGVHLDRETKPEERLHQVGQARVQSGFATADHHPVQPASTRCQAF